MWFDTLRMFTRCKMNWRIDHVYVNERTRHACSTEDADTPITSSFPYCRCIKDGHDYH